MVDIQTELQETAKSLRENLESAHPNVPAVVVWAFQCDHVRAAIARRLESGEQLTSTHVLPDDSTLRLRRVYFQFATAQLASKPPPAGILVQITDDNRVFQVADPFVPPKSGKLKGERSFSLRYSWPMPRAVMGIEALTSRFEEFVEREGLKAVFTVKGVLLRPGPELASGTCMPTLTGGDVVFDPFHIGSDTGVIEHAGGQEDVSNEEDDAEPMSLAE